MSEPPVDPDSGRAMTTPEFHQVPRGRRLYRLAVPAAALLAFGAMALLWAIGAQSLGLAILRVLGVEPGAVAFLDTHAILAAAECQRRGVEVYLSNPCDVLGRVHVYSPLWLTLVPSGLTTLATPWVGAVLDVLFILALAVVMPGRSGAEVAVMMAAVFSPMTLYAVERANNDLVVFLLVLGAGLMLEGSRRWRLGAYAVLVGAALLKYYPAVLLALVARERRRDALIVAAGAATALGVFAACYHDVLAQSLSNSARLASGLSYYTDSFSARNLPFGLATGLARLNAAGLFALALFAVLAGLALARVRRTVVLLEAAGIDWTGREMRFAAIGGLLVSACFLVAQNVSYRGIYLLLVLPGVVQSWRATGNPAARRFLACMVGAVLFVMWEEFLRRGLLAALNEVPGGRIPMVFWVVRELVWWWLIAALAALVACHVARLPLCRDGAAWLERVCPALGRKLPRLFRADPAADR
jgi:hypothetical protein